MGHLSLIVKATRLCNLRCTYCHDWRDGPDQTMSFFVMARMIASALKDQFHDTVEFIWHGGEPTVLPISFYEKALLVQSRFRRPGQMVMNLIQTKIFNENQPKSTYLLYLFSISWFFPSRIFSISSLFVSLFFTFSEKARYCSGVISSSLSLLKC